MMRLTLQIIVAALFFASSNSAPALAAGPEQADAATAWRLLDYIAVDYAEAVSEGAITSRGEYDEMVEFSQSANERIADLPLTTAKPDLVRLAARLKRAIADKAPAQFLAHGDIVRAAMCVLPWAKRRRRRFARGRIGPAAGCILRLL